MRRPSRGLSLPTRRLPRNPSSGGSDGGL